MREVIAGRDAAGHAGVGTSSAYAHVARADRKAGKDPRAQQVEPARTALGAQKVPQVRLACQDPPARKGRQAQRARRMRAGPMGRKDLKGRQGQRDQRDRKGTKDR